MSQDPGQRPEHNDADGHISPLLVGGGVYVPPWQSSPSAQSPGGDVGVVRGLGPSGHEQPRCCVFVGHGTGVAVGVGERPPEADGHRVTHAIPTNIRAPSRFWKVPSAAIT
jgi:hypothetical protein